MTPARLTRYLACVALGVLVAFALTACSRSKEPELKNVSEYNGLFHFQIPQDWQANTDSAVIAVYAGSELPNEEDTLDSLSVLVFTGVASDRLASEELLTDFVSELEASREWQDVSRGEPQEAQVGGRPAHLMELSATDSRGRRFKGWFYSVRTSGKDVLINAVIAEEHSADFAGAVAEITERWFWHMPASTEQTAAGS